MQCDFGVQVRGATVALTVNLRDQRVERANAITRGEQTIGSMRTNEACSPSRFHFCQQTFRAPEFATVLAQLIRKATPDATLNILQPNYRRAYKQYFADYTHVSVYSDVSLCDLQANGWRVLECRPGLLPFSLTSGLPVRPWVVRLYRPLPWKPAREADVRSRANR
jgi:hypothetical protein